MTAGQVSCARIRQVKKCITGALIDRYELTRINVRRLLGWLHQLMADVRSAPLGLGGQAGLGADPCLAGFIQTLNKHVR
jgi:hypothetical protein